MKRLNNTINIIKKKINPTMWINVDNYVKTHVDKQVNKLHF